jgi:glycerol-3-phosphate dehydrogenase (NAD(P)+)
MGPSVRVYTSQDIIGVELGGSLKNIIALASGVVDGLGLGDNAKAALVTRGLAEIVRLGKVLGAKAETFSGLSGLGDLVVTCMSQHSRNRRVGEELGRGRRLADILATMEMVAEGVETSRSAFMLARRENVEMPITAQMNRVLFEDVRPADALAQLMQRTRKEERDSDQ